MLKTRQVHRHLDKCNHDLAESPELINFKWYANGETEKHNAGGFGEGPYRWLVLICNLNYGCPGKLLVSCDDIVNLVIHG